MTPEEARDALRSRHQPGTRDLGTAVALTRAAVAEDWVALLALVDGLDRRDDVLGVLVWSVLVGGGGLMDEPERARRYLDRLADAEHESTGAQ